MSLTDPHAGYGVVPRRKSTYPRSNEEFLDLPKLIADFILDRKARPGRGSEDAFFLQGSCFAENLHNELKLVGHPCYYNAVVEALNSPLANLHYFRGLVQQPAAAVFQALTGASVFVLTIGVAPCWFRKGSGEFVMQPDLRHVELFEQRTLSVKESSEALSAVFDLVYRIAPDIAIVITLSPVPLARTFEFESAIVADCISKCTLRAAIHEALLAYPGRKPTYFPAFEIVRWVGAHAANAYGDDGLPRHVSKAYVRHIIASFLAQPS